MTKRRATKLITSFIIVLIMSALGYNVSQNGSVSLPTKEANVPPGYYAVTSVTDGDTINVKIAGKNETIRFIGIDTPEEKDPRKPVQCFAQAAADHMKSMVEGKSVRLEGDPQNTDRDKYKRLLRYVYLEDGTLTNAEQIKQGYAFAYTLFPFSKLDEFRGYESDARTKNLGLWAGCQIHNEGDKKQTQNVSQ